MLQYAYHGTKTMFSIIIIALVQLKIDALIFPTYMFRDYYFPSLEMMMSRCVTYFKEHLIMFFIYSLFSKST